MSQQVRKRSQKIIEFSASNKVSESLSRGMIYRELYLRLAGQLTLALINNTEAKTKRGDEWAVVSRIDVIANNTDVLRSFSGNTLWWLNYFMYGASPRITAAMGNGTDNPAFDSVLILPFWMPQSIRPIDTALDARNLSDLKVEITWGTHTDINGDATGFTVAPTLTIDSAESFGVEGSFSQSRVFTMEKEITATNSQFQVTLPVGPMYRGFLMNFTDANVDDDAVLNNFKLKSGTTVFADQSDQVLQQGQMIRTGAVRPWDAGAEGYDNVRRGTANALTGWYYYDHVMDGFLSEAIDTLGFSEFEIELDVTVGAGTTKAFIIPIQLIPVRGK